MGDNKVVRRILGCAVAAVLSAFGGSAAAQSSIYYSADNYGRANKSFSESAPNAQVLEVLMQRSDIFEPIYDLEAQDAFRKLGRAVGMLDLLGSRPDGTLANGTCTATLIAPNRAITNYHCVPGLDFTVTAAQLRLGYLDRMREPGQLFEVKLPAVESNREMDYAIVEVVGVPIDRFPPVTLKAVSPRPRQSLFIIHHPASQPQRLTRVRCQAGDPTTNDNDLVHHCDTLGGSSGALVLSLEDDAVVGLHKAGVPDPIRPFNLATQSSLLVAAGSEIKRLSNTQETGRRSSEFSARSTAQGPGAKRALSSSGAVLIAAFEGWQPGPYNDAYNNCTVGFGHLIAKASCESLPQEALESYRNISPARGLELLAQSTKSSEAAVERLVTRSINQNQFDALVSFVSNVGVDLFERSTLLRAVNAGDDRQTVNQWRRWVRSRNVLFAGLVERREAELKLYFGGAIPTDPAPAVDAESPATTTQQ